MKCVKCRLTNPHPLRVVTDDREEGHAIDRHGHQGETNRKESVIRVKKRINPIVSSMVVTRGPLTNAGSSLSRLSPIGSKVPSVTATSVLVAITIPATIATQRS